MCEQKFENKGKIEDGKQGTEHEQVSCISIRLI